ncbi:MAG: SRPBCC family protein [Myxococcota bacterium]|nr:SRPBCC family protein [Myxococcota bacterium]
MKTHSRSQEGSDGTALATGLGLFSIGLGLGQLAIPGVLAKLIGIEDSVKTRTFMRAMGVRGLIHGVGILSGPRRAGPLWSRVVGDVMDLGVLGLAATRPRNQQVRVLSAAGSVVGITALDLFASFRASRAQKSARRPVIRTVSINRPPSEVYAFWRDLEQLPRFMDYLEAVRDLGGGLSHWVAKTPVGGTVEWQATIIEDRPSELISWRAVEGSEVPNSGTVRFSPTLDGHGTEVRVEMQYDVPGGRTLGAMFAKLAAGPQIEGDLRRFKQVMETGEVVHSDASIHRGPHPARPSAERGLLT